ncbi:MAG: ABC transporter ATP-binding protein [Candidatus Latescibacteria bacterium]|nr:ABC transporter ATP-binding protein [Candidatus Latescibacterota bacterium]
MANKHSSLKLILRFSKFLKPYWKKGLAALFLMLLAVVLQLPMPFLTRYLIDKVIILKDFRILNIIGFVLIAVLLVRASSIFIERVLLSTFRARVLFDIRIALFQHLQRLSLRFFHDKETGYLMSRVGDDVGAVQGLLADTMVSFVQNTLTFIAGVACTLYIHPKLALISFSILPLYALSLKVFNKRIRNMSYEVRERYANVQKDLQELLSGISIIKAFSREKHTAIRMVRSTKEAVRKEVKLNILSALAGISSTVISAAGPLVLIWYGCAEIMRGYLTVGGLVAFNSFIRYLFGPTQALMNINFSVQRSLAACQRIFEMLDLQPEVKEKKEAVEPGRLRGDVVLQGVTFSYDSGDKILDRVSLRARPGQIVALVGTSGVGKTTLVSLIPRFYDPEQGRVLIDGTDIRDMRLRSLRDNIGIVSQETFLFSSTVRENIRFGRLGATDQEVTEAARLAQAHEFITRLPEGYDTQIGERGVKLSGGQRQRIAIARAVLRNPSILILDEATSNLDSESERAIQQALRPLMKNRTTFVIAHRLSTVLDADKIVVLDGGKVVAEGKHSEVYQSCPVYRRLYDEQFLNPRIEEEIPVQQQPSASEVTPVESVEEFDHGYLLSLEE